MTKIIPILLLIGITLAACSGAQVSTPVQEPLPTPASQSNAMCGTPTTWTVKFHRTGGFAGLDETLTLDNGGNLTVQSERPPANAEKMLSNTRVKQIATLLAQACPFEPVTAKNNCADCFLYTLDVQMDEQTYTVQATDVAMPKELSPLIDELSALFSEASQ